MRSSPTALVGLALTVAGFGCNNAPPPLEDGDGCMTGPSCPSGVCAAAEGGSSYRTCTEACISGGPCTATASSPRVCRETGYCGVPCADGEADGHGNLCEAGVEVACTSLSAASACARCGCMPFGGGVCMDGIGCTRPLADGSPCTRDDLCTSGACGPTGTCGPPAAIGAPCIRDRQCESANCSNDGNTATMGVCDVALGTGCMTTNCTDCVGGIGGTGIFCSREHCDPMLAPCASGWSCLHAVDMTYHCYEQCDPLRASICVDDLTYCNETSMVCQS